MKNMIEQIATEHNLDLSDSSQAIRALELLNATVKAQRQEISVDLSTLNAQEFAEHFDYQFSKLNSFVEEDNELSDVAYQAIKIANARKKKLLEEEEALVNEVKEKQARIKQIRSMLYAANSRVDVSSDVSSSDVIDIVDFAKKNVSMSRKKLAETYLNNAYKSKTFVCDAELFDEACTYLTKRFNSSNKRALYNVRTQDVSQDVAARVEIINMND